MIREQRVGMRVRINESFGGRYREGDTGEIIRVDGDNMPLVAVDGRNKVCITDSKLTEIKENGMYLHEVVKEVGETGLIKHETWEGWYTVTGTMELYSRVGTDGTGIRELSSRGWEVKPKPQEKQYCEYCGKKLAA
jgi:hypothetical protein